MGRSSAMLPIGRRQPAVMAGDTSIVGPPAMAYTSYGIRQQEPVGHGKKTTRFEQLHYAFEVRGLGGEPGVLMNNAIRTNYTPLRNCRREI